MQGHAEGGHLGPGQNRDRDTPAPPRLCQLRQGLLWEDRRAGEPEELHRRPGKQALRPLRGGRLGKDGNAVHGSLSECQRVVEASETIAYCQVSTSRCP